MYGKVTWIAALTLALSMFVPNLWIGTKLNLRPNLHRIGQFVSETGEVLFIDPTVGLSDSRAALVNKTAFFDFLKEENLECLWIVAGERNAWPSGTPDDYSCRSFAGVYRWLKKKWKGDTWYEDQTGTPS